MKIIDNKCDYRRKLPHVQKDNRAHFITCCTKGRLILAPECRDLVLKSCLFYDGKQMELHAVVVMPDHLHMICTMRREDKPEELVALRELMQLIKSYPLTRSINR